MTKLLQKAFDEAAKLSEEAQDALAFLLLEEIHRASAGNEGHSRAGMPWQEIRKRYPHQWLLLEAKEAYSRSGQRILESLAVLGTYADGRSAMRGYCEVRGQASHRELYVLHTDRKTLEIEEIFWAGIRRASWLEENREAIEAYNEHIAQHGTFGKDSRES